MRKFVDKVFHHDHQHDDQPAARERTKEHTSEHVLHHSPGVKQRTHKQPLPNTEVDRTHTQETVVRPVVYSKSIEVTGAHYVDANGEVTSITEPGVISRVPIIEETIQPVIIEEVRTIIHRQVAVPHIIHQEQHINERVVRPTVYKTTTIVEGEHEKPHFDTPTLETSTTSTSLINPTTTSTTTTIVEDTGVHKERSIETLPSNTKQEELSREALSSTHSSLDIRAQLSLERLADYQAAGYSGLPSTTTTSSSSHIERGGDDLAKGSEIGLDGTSPTASGARD